MAILRCPTDGAPASRLISVPARPLADADPYYDHGLDAVVTSRSQRKRLMAQQGLVERGTTTMTGTKGTIFSEPGRATRSVPKSGAYAGPLKVKA